MPVTDWFETTDSAGQKWLMIGLAQLRIPLPYDPSQGVFIAVAPPIGVVANWPALAKGDPGFPISFEDDVDLTILEYGDPTPDAASITEVSPATDVAGPTYRLSLILHKGPTGDDGTAVIDPSDYATDDNPATPGKILVVNADASGFIYASQKVGDTYYPASLNSTASGNANSTLGVVVIPGQPGDWRPEPDAQTIVTPTGSNVRVDVIARLNGETNGNDVGRGFGISGATERINITAGPPPGSADSYNRVAAGTSATVHLRVERQSGSDTFITSASTTRYGVKVNPIP